MEAHVSTQKIVVAQLNILEIVVKYVSSIPVMHEHSAGAYNRIK